MIRLLFLWHMHQPYYKDLVTGEYRLPWVRLHALKDYYGMVKLLDEFPSVHQTFNLVPSLIAQIEDYVSGAAPDPFLRVASIPAADLNQQERLFALEYLFQANPTHMIGRYPRYRELWQQFRAVGENPERAQRFLQTQDYTDLQVLSQIAWFDEFFLADRDVAALIAKGRDFTSEDQQLVIAKQQEFLSKVLPAYKVASKKGSIEISTSPYYHPILPLLCDTNLGRVSSPGLPLPQRRFRRPEDAAEQLRRGLDLHQRVFGLRPHGVWPSEGSISEEVMAVASKLGIEWMATDEGVLGRSLNRFFDRDFTSGRLLGEGPENLYTVYRYHQRDVEMKLLFRDHNLSDLIGFVYSGMPAKEAAQHFIEYIKESTKSLVDKKQDAVISIILDGENAWEYYPQSGREFLRRLYDGLSKEKNLEALTVSEAVARQKDFAELESLVPGSWIDANFRVWIGALEDNLAWDYLTNARELYQQFSNVAEDRRKLAFEELLIAEGSDWNWWYGPEHHSANDRDFDELYRKHLWNVYQALGAPPPDYLAQPIALGGGRPYYVPQTAFIHPRIDGVAARYFDWIGAAVYTADRRSSAMHGKQFLLDSVHAGIDEDNLYGRLDFAGSLPAGTLELIINIESSRPQPTGAAADGHDPHRKLRLKITLEDQKIAAWTVTQGEDEIPLDQVASQLELHLVKILEFRLPLSRLQADSGDSVRLRFSLWRDRLPIDALPLEGWIELQVTSDEQLRSAVF